MVAAYRMLKDAVALGPQNGLAKLRMATLIHVHNNQFSNDLEGPTSYLKE